MNNVYDIHPSMNVSQSLRNIADEYEKGEFGDNNATVIIGGRIFHIGEVNDGQCFSNVIIDMQYAINKLMVMQMETGGYDVDLIWIAMCFINGAIFALVIVVYFIGSIIKLYKFLSAYKANHKI